MNPEGQVTIRIGLRPEGRHVVQLSCDRPVLASRMLEGRSIDEALRLLPLIFNVCGQAQAAAGARACASALGEILPPAGEQARERLLALESLREQLWRIVLDWPALIERPPDRRPLSRILAIQRQWQTAAQTEDWRAPRLPDQTLQRHLLEQIRQLLQTEVFGMTISDWLVMDTLREFDAWLQRGATVASTAIAAVQRHGWAASGHVTVSPLPQRLDAGRLQAQLGDPAFARQPQWDGECRETSVFTRVDWPLLRLLRERYGDGLLPRMMARLGEIAQCFQSLAAATEVEVSPPMPEGVGEARAARGRLLHAVQLDGEEKIRRYRILAPTEWNFHPRGVVVQALAKLQGTADAVAAQARQLVQAIDPCVACDLQVEPLRSTAHA